MAHLFVQKDVVTRLPRVSERVKKMCPGFGKPYDIFKNRYVKIPMWVWFCLPKQKSEVENC